MSFEVVSNDNELPWWRKKTDREWNILNGDAKNMRSGRRREKWYIKLVHVRADPQSK